MKKILSLFLILVLLLSLACPCLADQKTDDEEKKRKKTEDEIALAEEEIDRENAASSPDKDTATAEADTDSDAGSGFDFSDFDFGSSETETDPEEQRAAAERGLEKIKTASFWEWLVQPKEESYLTEWRTGYARKAFKAPCLQVQRISELHTGRQVMPYIYEGVEATVVAEENDMSCMLYRGSDNQLYVGWIQSIRLLDEFPGLQYTVGSEPAEEYTLRDDLTVDWSKCSWLTTQQNYSVLSEEVRDCLGFTLEYQIIDTKTPNWDSILGPRTIYVKSGDEWTEVGEFPYDDFGAVKIQVWLQEPMDIDAVGTIALCTQPDIFWFRQTATDFAVPSGE